MRQIVAECIQIALRLLNLGELLGAAGFCDKVDRQLVRASPANEVGEIAELQSRLRLLGLLG